MEKMGNRATILPDGSPPEAAAEGTETLDASRDPRVQRFLGIVAPEVPCTLDAVSVGDGCAVPRITGEFWTSRQRQGHSLHEISYRACFKPQLPAYFIRKLTRPGELVYDPFGGRGTTALEAGLQGRAIASNDVNPLAERLLAPRLVPPGPAEVRDRLERLPTAPENADAGIDLSMFYHPDTLRQILALREYFERREGEGSLDSVDRWIRMVAVNRLTGHSPGFFSVYTLPPNQAASPDRQRIINRRYGKVPAPKHTKEIILRKTRQLLGDLGESERADLHRTGGSARLLTRDARHTPEIESGSVALTVTSPPFLDVVQYAADNWLRCWFVGLDADRIAPSISTPGSVDAWSRTMLDVFRELFRVTRSGGHVAFEVGEVRKGTLRLEEIVIPLAAQAGFETIGILVNAQVFTKTSNIWGIRNNLRGTNSNRIVLLAKD